MFAMRLKIPNILIFKVAIFFSIQMLFNFEFLSDILHMVSLTIDLSETCGSSQSFFQNINPTHKGNGIFGPTST